jgi:hypothetical protein
MAIGRTPVPGTGIGTGIPRDGVRAGRSGRRWQRPRGRCWVGHPSSRRGPLSGCSRRVKPLPRQKSGQPGSARRHAVGFGGWTSLVGHAPGGDQSSEPVAWRLAPVSTWNQISQSSRPLRPATHTVAAPVTQHCQPALDGGGSPQSMQRHERRGQVVPRSCSRSTSSREFRESLPPLSQRRGV